MRDWFFYQEHGKTMGPIELEDLRARIREGRVRLFDLIYKEGEPGWRMALEHPDLRGEFRSTSIATLRDRPWVCLHRRSPEGFDFLTLGPYSTEEVREGIRAGRISYNDYIWRNELEEWKRVGTVKEFNARVTEKKEAEPPSLPPVPPPSPSTSNESAEELLKNVVVFRRTPTPHEAKAPTESDGQDLTKIVSTEATRIVRSPDPDATRIVSGPPPIPTPGSNDETVIRPRELPKEKSVTLKRRASQSPPPPPPPSESEPVDTDEGENESEAKGPSRLLTDWSIVGGLVFILLLLIVVLARRLKSTDRVETPPMVVPGIEQQTQSPGELTPEPAPEPVPKSSPVAVSAPTPAPPPPPKVIDVAPTKLILSVQGSSDTQARIQVRTNGSAQYPVHLQIIGLPGQVAEGPAYYKYMTIKATGDLSQPLEIPQLKLPQGYYTLRADTGDLHKEVPLRLGVRETEYRQAVAKIRKNYAGAIWRERLKVYRLSQALTKALTEGLKSGSLKGRGLEALSVVKKTRGASYIFFDDWWELHDILDEAHHKVTPELVSRAEKVRDRVARFSVWKSK